MIFEAFGQYVEGLDVLRAELSGTMRRECLDHLIVIDERHLKRLLRNHWGYYQRAAA